jgi:hypothetical protein
MTKFANVNQPNEISLSLAPAGNPFDLFLYHPLNHAGQILIQPGLEHGAKRFANHVL